MYIIIYIYIWYVSWIFLDYHGPLQESISSHKFGDVWSSICRQPSFSGCLISIWKSNWYMLASMRQTRKSGRIWKWHARHRKNERVCFELLPTLRMAFWDRLGFWFWDTKNDTEEQTSTVGRLLSAWTNYINTYETMLDRLTLQPAADSAFALWQGKCTPFRGFLWFAKSRKGTTEMNRRLTSPDFRLAKRLKFGEWSFSQAAWLERLASSFQYLPTVSHTRE